MIKLAGFIAITQELKYHLNCRSNLKNKARSVEAAKLREGYDNDKILNAYSMAFSELGTSTRHKNQN